MATEISPRSLCTPIVDGENWTMKSPPSKSPISEWCYASATSIERRSKIGPITSRKLSPPKHIAKLPPWSALWYCWYHYDLAHHMYVSYIDSLMSHLPLLCMPRFGSEAILSPYSPIRRSWGVFTIVLAHRYSGLLLSYGNSPYCYNPDYLFLFT